MSEDREDGAARVMSPFQREEQFAARVAVEAFLAEYVLALDGDRLETWADFFTDDGLYQVTTRENHDQGLPLCLMSCNGRGMLLDRISALRTANIFEPHVYCHIPGALRLTSVSEESIEAESTFSVIRTMPDGAMSLFACGRSRDRVVNRPDGLKLAERIVILDSRQIDTLLVIPL